MRHINVHRHTKLFGDPGPNQASNIDVKGASGAAGWVKSKWTDVTYFVICVQKDKGKKSRSFLYYFKNTRQDM